MAQSQNPYWLQLLKYWVESKQGTSGLTIPFIIGVYNEYLKQSQTVASLFDKIKSTEDLGELPLIRRCSILNEYILTAETTHGDVAEFIDKTTGKPCLRVLPEIQKELGCKNIQKLSDKFSELYDNRIRDKEYSKHNEEKWGWFTPTEEDWIADFLKSYN